MTTTSATAAAPDGAVLTSLWDGLSPHLIASFWEVQRVGSSQDWDRVPDGAVVRGPLTSASLDVTADWQSPFEGAGQSTIPTIKAMLQSGAFGDWLPDASAKFASQFEGRAGVTKLNSTQVFGGMPPLKVSITLLLRAWADAAAEVEAPVNQLMQWALPRALAEDGPLMSILRSAHEAGRGNPFMGLALLPSEGPARIAMRYKGAIYSPMVIESIGLPIDSPVDANGHFVQLAVPMTLCSLSAIDARDWKNAHGGGQSSHQGFKS